MTLPSAVLRVLGAAAVSSAVAWLGVSSSHPCDSAGSSAFGWLLLVLPAAAGIVCSLPRTNPVVCVGGGLAASLAMVAAIAIDVSRDGNVSPSGATCETAGPAIAGVLLLLGATFVLLTVALLVLHLISTARGRGQRSRAAQDS
jgi:hypothetical protein